jgi:hypothetical protein
MSEFGYPVNGSSDFVKIAVNVGTTGVATTIAKLSTGVLIANSAGTGGDIPPTVVGAAANLVGVKLMVRTQIHLPIAHSPIHTTYYLSGGVTPVEFDRSSGDLVCSSDGLDVTITKIIDFL